jgi:hypothetical protein
LRYLRSTVFQSLLLSSTSFLKLRAYSDADHGSDLIDRKFVTGFCIFLIRWFSYFLEKQETIYCFSIIHRSRISCHDIYYQRDYLVTLVNCWYESFFFSSYSYVLWQLEFYSDCSQLGFL